MLTSAAKVENIMDENTELVVLNSDELSGEEN